MRAVVTGANRGIGLELTRQLLAHGAQVEATARRPAEAEELLALAQESGGRLKVHPLDVADVASVHHFAGALAPGGINLLINNAGVGGGGRRLDELATEALLRVFSVNAVGPLRVTQALLPRLREARWRKVVHITSLMGSIEDNRSGGAYGYRMSKAALNMASRSLAVDLQAEGILSVVLHPGWVQTDMGGEHAPLSVEESVRGMLELLQTLGPEQSGGFFNWDGRPLPF
jgi:NAD(P)-dependent dehydrogenase (short-subunit alcohol dehydrogenase family)